DINDQKKSVEDRMRSDRLKALAEMSGAAAHNLRNMMQIIVGGIRTALSHLESGNATEVRSDLDMILGHLRAAGETARLLNHFANARKDKALPVGRIFDLSEAVEKAVDISRAWLEGPNGKGGKINLLHECGTGCLVKGVQNELLEVVVNLIWNAADAVAEGGTIALRTFVEGRNAVLQVEDDGLGIAKENLSKIFQPFWTTKGPLGSGLGLSSSYGIVSRHSGEITVESTEGEGSVFTVRLPIADRGYQIENRLDAQPADFTCRILVVDDLEPVLRTLQSGLTRMGQTVLTATTGREALELFKEQDFDIVISDLAMPEMNGWQVGKGIVGLSLEKGTPKPPFVMLTGWAAEVDDPERMIDCGVSRVLEKPVDIPKLLGVIRELTQNTE
ncbi:MAG: ATP-binding protein, partial [Pseudomonadota bacterium]